MTGTGGTTRSGVRTRRRPRDSVNRAALLALTLLAPGCAGAYAPPPLPPGHPALAATPPAPMPAASTALSGEEPLLPPPAKPANGGHDRHGDDPDAHGAAHEAHGERP